MNQISLLPEQIRLKRLQKGLSQENMADLLGMSTTAYGDIERGRTELTLPRLEKIAAVLEFPVIELLGIRQEPDSELEWMRRENLRLQAENLQLRTSIDQLKRKFQEVVGNELLLRIHENRERIGF